MFVNNMCDAAMCLLKSVLDFGEARADNMDIHTKLKEVVKIFLRRHRR